MKKNYVCPNCGTEVGSNQCDCPNCGCSISLVEIDEQQIESDEKTSRSKLIWYLLGFIFIIGAFITYERKQEQQQLLEQQRIEQQRIEQQRIEQQRIEQERREQEEQRKREEQREREISRKKESLCAHPWKQIHGDPYGTCLVEYIKFSKNGSLYIAMKRYAGGNLVHESSGEWLDYRIDGNRVYVEGTFEFDFDGTNLISKRGVRYKRGDSLFDYY
jgi:hypothetical protein